MTSALAPDEASRALFERYPRLRKKLPHAVLAELPTPVARLEKLGAKLGASRLYVKRDDLTARPYGGNKIRKLEFILGQALGERARSVMTFGVDGSNHVVATALYARKMGLECIGMLCPQTNAGYVRKNLLAHLAASVARNQLGIPLAQLLPFVTRPDPGTVLDPAKAPRARASPGDRRRCGSVRIPSVGGRFGAGGR